MGFHCTEPSIITLPLAEYDRNTFQLQVIYYNDKPLKTPDDKSYVCKFWKMFHPGYTTLKIQWLKGKSDDPDSWIFVNSLNSNEAAHIEPPHLNLLNMQKFNYEPPHLDLRGFQKFN